MKRRVVTARFHARAPKPKQPKPALTLEFFCQFGSHGECLMDSRTCACRCHVRPLS